MSLRNNSMTPHVVQDPRLNGGGCVGCDSTTKDLLVVKDIMKNIEDSSHSSK